MTQPAYFVNESRIHGRGMFAARLIMPGEAVAEYSGKRFIKNKCPAAPSAGANAFIFELDEQYDLDGNNEDNLARFANHSCEPNCEAVAEQNHIALRALRAIAAGEELTYDYGYRLSAFPGHRCCCGALSCAGFIVARGERWRVRRLLNRPGRSLLNHKMNPSQEACA